MNFLAKITALCLIAISINASDAEAKKSPALEIFPYNQMTSPQFQQVQPTQQTYQQRRNFNAYDTAPIVHQKKVIFQAPRLNLSYEDFLTYADKSVNYLIRNRSDHFIANISPNMLQYFGPEKLEQNVASTLVPYFSNFKAFEKDMTVAPTRDAWGNEGYSFYQSFLTKSGDRKKFVLQMVIEDGQIVVANLTPDIESPYQ